MVYQWEAGDKVQEKKMWNLKKSLGRISRGQIHHSHVSLRQIMTNRMSNTGS